MRWTCPNCDREFERAHQAHVCAPGCTVESTFARRPEYQRATYDTILAHLRRQGDVHEDAVRVGVFLKAARKVAEVRPMARALALLLILPRTVHDPRIVRRYPMAAGRVMHDIRLHGPDEVDEQLRDWLDEAFAAADE